MNTILYMFTFYTALIGIGLIVLIFLFKRFTGKKTNKKTKVNNSLRGSRLEESSDPKGFIFGKKGKKKVYLPSDREGHITIFGGSGQGKTSALLIPSLRAWNAPFLAIDISGDISKNVKGEKQKTLCPDDPDESCIYNVFYAVDACVTPFEKKEKIELLVNSMMQLEPNANDAQHYFIKTGRKIFLAAMLAFYDIGMDFTDICKTIFFNDTESLFTLIKQTKNELALGYMQPLLAENEKNVAGAKNTLNDKIKIFADNLYLEKILRRPITDFDGNVEPSLKPNDIEEYQIFIKVPDKKQEYYGDLMNIVIGQFLEYISGREYNPAADKRILIALDEFASIGHLEILSPIRKFRKNGANICILTQSLADIDLTYSEKERQVILDNSQYIVVLNANDNATREYFSNLVGKEDEEQRSYSTNQNGGSESVSIHKEHAILPEEWKDFADKLIVIHPAGYYKLTKNYYFKN